MDRKIVITTGYGQNSHYKGLSPEYLIAEKCPGDEPGLPSISILVD
jgi:hypothetical protein